MTGSMVCTHYIIISGNDKGTLTIIVTTTTIDKSELTIVLFTKSGPRR